MYHATPAGSESLDYFGVPRTAFEEQVTALRALGLRGVTLESCCNARSDEGRVAITFDDAHQSNHRVAWPILADAGMTATVFVVPAWVGTEGYCTWPELRELSAAGWSIQSHTFSHPFLSTLDRADARREIMDSRERIEQAISAPVTTLALPNGDWPARRHRDLLQEAGYRIIATSRWHANGDAETRRGVIGRYTVRRVTGHLEFVERITSLPGFWSREGLRLSALSMLREILGVERYRAWRRRFLDEQPSPIARATSKSSPPFSMP